MCFRPSIVVLLLILFTGQGHGSSDLASCFTQFEKLTQARSFLNREYAKGRQKQARDWDELVLMSSEIEAAAKQGLTQAKKNEQRFQDQVDVWSWDFAPIKEKYLQKSIKLRDEEARVGEPLPSSHELKMAHERIRGGYYTLKSSYADRMERLKIAKEMVGRAEKAGLAITAHNTAIQQRGETPNDWQEGTSRLSAMADELEIIRRAISPMEITLSAISGSRNIELDEIRYRDGEWIAIEEKEALGLDKAKEHGIRLEEHPLTGEVFSSHEKQWAYQQIYEKTVKKVSLIRLAERNPARFRTFGSKHGSAVIPTVEEISKIRTIRFEIEGASQSLIEEANISIKQLRLRYQNLGWKFEVGFGIKPSFSPHEHPELTEASGEVSATQIE